MKRTPLYINSISHFLVDLVCIAALFSFGDIADTDSFVFSLTVYNILAFMTQCLVGLLMDKVGHLRLTAVISCLTVAFGALLPLPLIAKAMVVGTGNSFFHVAAGADTLKASCGRAKDLGVFVAPGAFGVTAGRFYPQLTSVFAVFLILAAAAEFALYRFEIGHLPEPRCEGQGCKITHAYRCDTQSTADIQRAAGARRPIKAVKSVETVGTSKAFAAVLLTAAVAVRAIGGSAVTFGRISGISSAMMLTASVFAGKALGGFVFDKVGAVKTSYISIPPAAFLIAFGSQHTILSLAGQAVINLTMPVTLYLLYRIMPENPGLAFGLAATALLPGTVLGQLVSLSGAALDIFVLLAMLFGFGAIIISDRIIRKWRSAI